MATETEGEKIVEIGRQILERHATAIGLLFVGLKTTSEVSQRVRQIASSNSDGDTSELNHAADVIDSLAQSLERVSDDLAKVHVELDSLWVKTYAARAQKKLVDEALADPDSDDKSWAQVKEERDL